MPSLERESPHDPETNQGSFTDHCPDLETEDTILLILGLFFFAVALGVLYCLYRCGGDRPGGHRAGAEALQMGSFIVQLVFQTLMAAISCGATCPSLKVFLRSFGCGAPLTGYTLFVLYAVCHNPRATMNEIRNEPVVALIFSIGFLAYFLPSWAIAVYVAGFLDLGCGSFIGVAIAQGVMTFMLCFTTTLAVFCIDPPC